MNPARRSTVAAVAAAAAVLVSVVGAGAIAYASAGAPAASLTEPSQPQEVDASPEPDADPTETATPTEDHECGDTGEYQAEVEAHLEELGGFGEVFVDGEQSVEDCEAITAFQERYGIEPAAGYAGEVTHRVAQRLVETDVDECDSDSGPTVCIDLTNQTLWVASRGDVEFEPTVVRTGMAGYATQPGMHEITNKAESEWSTPYEVWLPYWQHFFQGQGLHETTTYLHDDANGSHGCVNLLPDDAVELYQLMDVGDSLHVFGHRPGT